MGRAAWRATVTAAAAVGGGGSPAVVVWAAAVCGACARSPRVPGGGREPPGRLWGSSERALPGGLAPDGPVV